MTYGEFLRACRTRAGIESKSEFSRRLGFKDPDHYIGAENDTGGKEPGRELLEKAARLAGFEFTDCIQLPEKEVRPQTREEQRIHRRVQELLEIGGEAADWIKGNINTFHKAYVRKRR